MSTPSVASLSKRHNTDDQDAPAMLDRVRGLASGIKVKGPSASSSSKMPMRSAPSPAGGVLRRDMPPPHTRTEIPRSILSSATSSTPHLKPLHRHTQTGRISKTRLHPLGMASPSPPPPPPLPSTAIPLKGGKRIINRVKPVAATLSSNSTKPSCATKPTDSSSSSVTPSDMDSPVLSFWGPEPVPLPSRFARIKRNLIAGHETELEASWARLIAALRADVEHIEGLGAHLIPSLEFGDLADTAQTARFGRDLRRYGVGVVRKVVPRADVVNVVQDTIQYLDDRRRGLNTGGEGEGVGGSKVNASAPQQDPTCFDLFWTPAQVRSRAHPNVLSAQRFMMGLWEATPEDRLAARLPISYADRLRIHGPGYDSDSEAKGSPNGDNKSGSIDGLTSEGQSQTVQSADDWIHALQSSAGIIAQVDNGSLERWEPDGYGRAGTYNRVLQGRWEDYDPWECASRALATMDLYNGYGACTIFRMFQGLLALSTIEPGMVRLLPSPKLAAAYYILRPFFTPRQPPPAPGPPRPGPEWDAYLAPENWMLQREPDTTIHGAVPGHAQRITENWHPHLYLRSSMVTLPTLQPGDYIFWHPDLPYHISSQETGAASPNSPEYNNVSMLVYIPAAPLTQTNALYLARQRKAFQRGHPGPDFNSGQTVIAEDSDSRPGEREIAEAGGPAGLRAMGLAPWEVAETRTGTRAGTPVPPPSASKDRRLNAEDEEMADADAEPTLAARYRSPASMSATSMAEAEVVRLANLILFPDESMVGYSV